MQTKQNNRAGRITKEFLESWEKQLPIKDYFPLNFKRGSSIEQLDGICSECEKKVNDEDFRGSVLEHDTFAELRSWVFCVKCNLFSRIDIDLWDDLTIVGKESIDSKEICIWNNSITNRKN